MSKHGNESLELLQKIQQEKIKGTIGKRFEDEFFALDLLKILYDDSEDIGVKTELLILLEEYGHLGLNNESIDQLVTSLLDIYSQAVGIPANWTFVCQALITSTSLLMQLQQLEAEICGQLVKKLVAIVTTSVNQPDSQRLRCCACQCLLHMEEFQPGLLMSHLDDFVCLLKQERTQVYQDYALLAAKVMEFAGRMPEKGPESPALLAPKKSTSKYQKSPSIDAQDLRQTAAIMLESAPLFTRCGSHRIMQSLVDLAKHRPEISPMMFKSLLLHQMPTMSCVLLHTVLYIQRQFEGEILTVKEESELVDRLCIMADHPSLNILHKLLACQWAKTYKQNDTGEPIPHECILQRHRLRFYPSVFDPVDLQLSKLYMTSFCSTDEEPDGVETSILLGSLGYLHKLVWHTGSGRAAIALFKALYNIYTTHYSQAFGTDIQRFVRGLISEFPNFIPHSVDFIDSVRKLDITSCIYTETLALLHQQVVTATKEQVFRSFPYYLQILKKVAVEKTIHQASTVKFLCYLAINAAEMDDSSWKLGHDLLEICRNLLTCHGSQKYFIGERRKSNISKARKRSMHMVYTLENFFVMDPDSISVPIDTNSDQDEAVSDGNDEDGIELKSTDKSLSDGSEQVDGNGKGKLTGGHDESLLLQANPVATGSHSDHVFEKEHANGASMRLEQFHETDHDDITSVECCNSGKGLNDKVNKRSEKVVDSTLTDTSERSSASQQNEDPVIKMPVEQTTAAREVLAEIHEMDKPEKNIITLIKDRYHFNNSAEEMEQRSTIRVIQIADSGNEEKVEENQKVDADTSETSKLLSKANKVTDQEDVGINEQSGKRSMDEDHDTNSQSERPDSVATTTPDFYDTTYETTTLIDGTSYQDIATSLIEIRDDMPNAKEEVWHNMLRESFQRSVVDFSCFMLTFLLCVTPQLVLDVINVQGDSIELEVRQSILLSADIGVSVLFLAFTLIFLWRVKVLE